MMIALGMFFPASFVSAARAVQLSKPTRMRMAIVDCTSMPESMWGLMISNPPEKAQWAMCSGFARRYQMARPEKTRRVPHWMMLMPMAVKVEPVMPR